MMLRTLALEIYNRKNGMASQSFLMNDDPALRSGTRSFRTALPEQQEPAKRPSAMTVLKPVLGGEGFYNFLYKSTFPSQNHEPLSDQQRRAETMQCSGLLDQAAAAPAGSQERLLLVAAFGSVSSYTCLQRCTHTAYNPLMLETFEVVSEEQGYKYVMEEVYRDVPSHTYIGAGKAWGRHWTLDTETQPKIKFHFGSLSLDFNMNHRMEITFDDGDFYSAVSPPAKIGSLGSETQTFTYIGSLVASHPASGLGAEIDLREPSKLASKKSKHQLKGWLTKGGEKVDGVKIHGAWDSLVQVTTADGKTRTLWQAPKPTVPPNRFGLADFALQLNYLTPQLDAVLPPTDSRRRPDIRAIESGLYQQADREQKRIYEKNISPAGPPPSLSASLWFTPCVPNPLNVQPGTQLRYRYKNGPRDYWEARAAAARGDANAWKACPDIY